MTVFGIAFPTRLMRWLHTPIIMVLALSALASLAAPQSASSAASQSSVPAGYTIEETISVPVDGSTVTSTTTLVDGVTYKLQASGTFYIGGPGDRLADAEYHDFTNPVDTTCLHADGNLGLGVDEPIGGLRSSSWGSFNPTHIYTKDYLGRGAPINLNYHDCAYSDNSGQLTIQIFRSTSPQTIMAGDFNGFFALDDEEPVRERLPRGTVLGNKGSCTAGFAVTKNSTRYMLTANHCRAWTAVVLKNGKVKSQEIFDYSKFVTVVGDGPSRPDRPVYAHSIDCSGAGTDGCLRPSSDEKPNDILAWRPDPGTIRPTGQLRTVEDVNGVHIPAIYPVLGAKDWDRNQEVCRMGQATKVERCGRIRRFDSRHKLVYMEDHRDNTTAEPGDSGGPVYAYERGPDGKRIGVWAIGITTDQSVEEYLGVRFVSRTYFMPIATVKSLLGVEVLKFGE